MNQAEADLMAPLVQRVSRFVGHDFPGCELEDIEQGVWLWLLEHPKYRDPEEENIFSILIRAAKGVAWNDRKESMQTSVQYHYRPSDVRKLLETVFDTSMWCDAKVPDDVQKRIGFTPEEQKRLLDLDYGYVAKNDAAFQDWWNKSFKS